MSFGRLDPGEKSAPMSDINMTPLIDVMLVLVVIFIVTAPLLASAIRLDLPRSDAARPVSSAALTLVVDAAGQTFLDDRPVSLERLAQELTRTAQVDPQTEVRLRADARVPYGRVLEVMGVAQKSGLGRIGFVADPAPAAKP
jgi:biopolymer transport protein TolR